MDRPVLLSNEHIKQANISSNYGRCIVCKAGFGSPKTSLELMCVIFTTLSSGPFRSPRPS